MNYLCILPAAFGCGVLWWLLTTPFAFQFLKAIVSRDLVDRPHCILHCLDLTGDWGFITISIAEWCMAVPLGLIAGAIVPRAWIQVAVLCSLGLVLGPCMLALMTFGSSDTVASGFGSVLEPLLWRCPSCVPLIVGAWIGRGRRATGIGRADTHEKQTARPIAPSN